MTKPRSLAGMARSLWLKLVNRAAGTATAQMRRDKPKTQGAKPAAKQPATKPAEKPGRTAAKNARKAAQATRRKRH